MLKAESYNRNYFCTEENCDKIPLIYNLVIHVSSLYTNSQNNALKIARYSVLLFLCSIEYGFQIQCLYLQSSAPTLGLRSADLSHLISSLVKFKFLTYGILDLAVQVFWDL